MSEMDNNQLASELLEGDSWIDLIPPHLDLADQLGEDDIKFHHQDLLPATSMSTNNAPFPDLYNYEPNMFLAEFDFSTLTSGSQPSGQTAGIATPSHVSTPRHIATPNRATPSSVSSSMKMADLRSSFAQSAAQPADKRSKPMPHPLSQPMPQPMSQPMPQSMPQVMPQQMSHSSQHVRAPSTTPAADKVGISLAPPPPMEKFKKAVVKRQGPLKTAQDKKKAHNAVERRYRNSINDRIAELKTMLPDTWTSGPKVRTNKAAILYKVIEYLNFLQGQNVELFEENARLHSMLEAHNIHDTLAPVNLNAKAAAEASAAAKHSQTLVGQVRANMGDEAMFQDDHRNKSPVVSNGHASPLTDTDSAPSPYTMFAGGTTKLMMATTLIALFFFGTSPLIAAPAEHVFASAGGGRVLNSIELEHVGVAAAAGAWFMQYGVWWVLRAVVLFVGVLIGLARDPMSQSDTALVRAAQDHERKAETSLMLGHHETAQWHANKALDYLGQPRIVTQQWSSKLAFASQVSRQCLHRLRIGYWLDVMLNGADTMHSASLVSLARCYHHLHQAKTMSRKEEPDALLAALQAVNAAEAAGSHMDAADLERIYIALASQLVISGRTWIAGRYLSLAAQHGSLMPASSKKEGSLSWVYQPEGQRFFLSGEWADMVLSQPTGTSFRPGSLSFVSLAFRVKTLGSALEDLVCGRDLAVASSRLLELQHISQHAHALQEEWWALACSVAVAWQQSDKSAARHTLIQLENLDATTTQLQEGFYAALRARQAFVDGDHVLCWRAVGMSSRLLRHIVKGAVPAAYSDDVHRALAVLALRQITATRIALYRLRSYYGAVNPSGMPPLQDEEGVAVDFQAMLAGLEEDTDTLSLLQEACAYVEPMLLMLRAISRSLIGGRTEMTEHLFTQSRKAAVQLKQPYDLALVLLHTCACLRTAIPVSDVRRLLLKAESLFEQLGASDELVACKKLKKMVS